MANSTNKTLVSCAYHRMDMMNLRYKLRMFYYTVQGVVKAHSSKHSKYVAIPKPLMYHLLDELDTIIDEAYKKSTSASLSSSVDRLATAIDYTKTAMVEAFMDKPLAEWRKQFKE